MPDAQITRQDFLDDRQGRTFADVANDATVPFDELLAFFSDAGRQRRMLEAELHHDRSPLAGVVRELEVQPAIDQFLSAVHHKRTRRFRQAVGVIVRIIMTRNGWRRTGRKGSLGVRATENLEMPAHNKGGLAFWFVRAERYELESGMPFRSVLARRRELEERCAGQASTNSRKARSNGAAVRSSTRERPKGPR